MTFPNPDVYTSDAQDIPRDERERLASPPSYFTTRVQGLLVAGVLSAARYVRRSDAQIVQQSRFAAWEDCCFSREELR